MNASECVSHHTSPVSSRFSENIEYVFISCFLFLIFMKYKIGIFRLSYSRYACNNNIHGY